MKPTAAGPPGEAFFPCPLPKSTLPANNVHKFRCDYPGTTIGAAITGIIQEYLKRQLERSYLSPPRIPANDRRNSIILLGLEKTGKTTLIRELFEDNNANPSRRTSR